MHKGRPCDESKRFTPWIPGLSPKDHIDMDALQKQREWQAAESKERRDWEDRTNDRQRDWQAQESRKSTWIIVAAMLLSAILGAWLTRQASPQPVPAPITPAIPAKANGG